MGAYSLVVESVSVWPFFVYFVQKGGLTGRSLAVFLYVLEQSMASRSVST
jgi:hypothetical protein